MSVALVISDLHLGSGRLDDFEPEIERHFARFLADAANEPAIELIINGDFLDFVQASPAEGDDLESETTGGIPLCFTENQSREKFQAILAQHPGVFSALRAFLEAHSGNRVTILPGNHDADFFWDSVCEDLKIAVAGDDEALKSRLHFHLETVYRPDANPSVWIEHGHQRDAVNRFYLADTPCWSKNNRPIANDRFSVPRLLECPGTRLLIQYLNALDVEYPFLDNVKPFKRFLELWGISAVTPRYGPLKAGIAVGRGIAYLAHAIRHRREDVLGIEERDPDAPLVTAEEFILQAYEAALPSARREFIRAVLESGFQLDRGPDLLLADPVSGPQLIDHLWAHPEVLAPIDVGEGGDTLSLGKAFFANEGDELANEVDGLLREPGVSAVIMGHTHEIMKPSAERQYINTGCWIRYFLVQPGEKLPSWSMLKASGYQRFPYSLNWARIEPERPPVLCTLPL